MIAAFTKVNCSNCKDEERASGRVSPKTKQPQVKPVPQVPAKPKQNIGSMLSQEDQTNQMGLDFQTLGKNPERDTIRSEKQKSFKSRKSKGMTKQSSRKSKISDY